MKIHIQMTILITVIAVGLISAGCEGGDPNTPEGIFKGCYTQVSNVQNALEAALRTRGTLEGFTNMYDIYNYMSGGSETKYKELERRQEMYCLTMSLQTNAAEDYYLIEAVPLSARKCQIYAEPGDVPEPRDFYECSR